MSTLSLEQTAVEALPVYSIIPTVDEIKEQQNSNTENF
jgi:hypothetical protein